MMRAESPAMSLFNRLYMERIAWSLRRLHCPVDRNKLVLEVGSGGNPYPRSNVLLDAYEVTIERAKSESRLVRDRPLVLGYVESLPFQDKSFDFVIASHVLEHSLDPDTFLKEIMRVARAGYIETPNIVFERLNPYTYHRLEIATDGSKLTIYRKSSWRHAKELVDNYDHQLKKQFVKYMYQHPALFNTRLYWQDNIVYEIVNPDVDISWPIPDDAHLKYEAAPPPSPKMRLRNIILPLVRRLFSQNKRNQRIDVFKLLQCPTCAGTLNMTTDRKKLICTQCQTSYPIREGVPVMFPQ